MRLTIPWLWGALLVVTCSGPRDEANAGLERQASDHARCASDEARRVLSDDTGDSIARAYRTYVPDEREMKLMAAWWILLLASAETGALDPALLLPEFRQEISSIAMRYSTSFDACAGSVELSISRRPLITSEQSFTCDGNCIPSAQILKDTLRGVLTRAVERAEGPIFSLIQSVGTIAEGLVSAKDLGKTVGDVVDETFTRSDAEATLRSVAALVASAGAIASAATLIVSTGPVVAEIAAVGSAVALLLEADKLSSELVRAYELVNACRAFKQRECMAACTCSQEVLEYAGSGVTSSCIEWLGAGPTAFCQSLPAGTNQCCTCTDASLLAFSDCAMLLSFDSDAAAIEYEGCCHEAAGLLNAKSTPPPQCPCSQALP